MVQDRGGAELQTGGILLYVEDLKRGTNKDIGPKDIFEMASNKSGQNTQTELKTRKEDYNIMVEVTEEATKQIQEYFNGKEVTPIRIFLNAGG